MGQRGMRAERFSFQPKAASSSVTDWHSIKSRGRMNHLVGKRTAHRSSLLQMVIFPHGKKKKPRLINRGAFDGYEHRNNLGKVWRRRKLVFILILDVCPDNSGLCWCRHKLQDCVTAIRRGVAKAWPRRGQDVTITLAVN